MTYRAWICESCQRPQRFRSNVWDCPGCGREGCDSCFWMYAHCKPCCQGKTEVELRTAANAAGWDFVSEESGEASPPDPDSRSTGRSLKKTLETAGGVLAPPSVRDPD